MNPDEVKSYVEKAEKYVETAEHLLKYGDYDSSVSRAYYSMYFMAKALLLTKSSNPKTHSGTISEFSRIFIKTEILPISSAKLLKKGFETRLLGDYNISVEINEDEAKDLVETAQSFIEKTRRYLIDINVL